MHGGSPKAGLSKLSTEGQRWLLGHDAATDRKRRKDPRRERLYMIGLVLVAFGFVVWAFVNLMAYYSAPILVGILAAIVLVLLRPRNLLLRLLLWLLVAAGTVWLLWIAFLIFAEITDLRTGRFSA